MSTTPTATPAPAAASLSAALKVDAADAVSQLSAYVTTVTGQSEASVRAFAQAYGPRYAEAAAAVVAAKLSGDAAELSAAEVDVDVLNDDAVMDAAMVAIDAEAAGETRAMNVLNGFINTLVAHLLA